MSASLVDNMATDFAPEKFSDEYQDQLKKLIAAKLEQGDKLDTAATFGEEGEKADDAEVIDLMEALRQSVERNRAAPQDPGQEDSRAKKTAARSHDHEEEGAGQEEDGEEGQLAAGAGHTGLLCKHGNRNRHRPDRPRRHRAVRAARSTSRSSPTTRSGIILIVAGVLALAIGLFMQFPRGRTKHVQENRYEGPPPAA